MMLSATVAAVVVISIERHRAVLHPLNEVNKYRLIIGLEMLLIINCHSMYDVLILLLVLILGVFTLILSVLA